jgi:cyclophilin family peptidyl-prolyl cis-trans isomerase
LGGESIFEKEFQNEYHTTLSHDRPGLISMANKGKDTNTSQFFFTLAECKHLDLKHTVFGEVIKGLSFLFLFLLLLLDLLEYINDLEVDKKDRPVKDINIIDTIVIENPYRTFVKSFKKLSTEFLQNNK